MSKKRKVSDTYDVYDDIGDVKAAKIPAVSRTGDAKAASSRSRIRSSLAAGAARRRFDVISMASREVLPAEIESLITTLADPCPDLLADQPEFCFLHDTVRDNFRDPYSDNKNDIVNCDQYCRDHCVDYLQKTLELFENELRNLFQDNLSLDDFKDPGSIYVDFYSERSKSGMIVLRYENGKWWRSSDPITADTFINLCSKIFGESYNLGRVRIFLRANADVNIRDLSHKIINTSKYMVTHFKFGIVELTRRGIQ